MATPSRKCAIKARKKLALRCKGMNYISFEGGKVVKAYSKHKHIKTFKFKKK